MTAKEEYRALCEDKSLYIPLFQQHWWMETVCAGKRWDVLLARDKDGAIQAALPYLVGSKLGLRYILQPQLTQYNGPWFHPLLDFQQRQVVASELIRQLDTLNISIFCQCFHSTVTDWLPFHWAGYRQTTRYTYRFPSIADPDALFDAASRARRRNMADVEKTCTIDTDFPPDKFATMHHEYFERKCGSDLLPMELVERVCNAALKRGQSLLWALRNADGEAVNVLFVVFDDRCAYALLSAIAPNAPRNSQTYLFWQMIRHLSTHTQAFDFEGSMDKGIEFYYQSFGAVQTPYHCVYRSRIPFSERLLHL